MSMFEIHKVNDKSFMVGEGDDAVKHSYVELVARFDNGSAFGKTVKRQFTSKAMLQARLSEFEVGDTGIYRGSMVKTKVDEYEYTDERTGETRTYDYSTELVLPDETLESLGHTPYEQQSTKSRAQVAS